jgi:hypothetical protein
MKSPTREEQDFVAETRKVRAQLEREFKSLEDYCDHLHELDLADPKTNPALLSKKVGSRVVKKMAAGSKKSPPVTVASPRRKKAV